MTKPNQIKLFNELINKPIAEWDLIKSFSEYVESEEPEQILEEIEQFHILVKLIFKYSMTGDKQILKHLQIRYGFTDFK